MDNVVITINIGFSRMLGKSQDDILVIDKHDFIVKNLLFSN